MKSFDETWEKIHSECEWGMYPSEHVIRFMARNFYRCNSEGGVKVLDFGCGAGSNTWYLAREGFDTYAFDGSASAVHRVQRRLEKENLTADLRVRDALELDYEDEFFDCIIDNVVIYANYYNNILEMYRKIFQMLKNGGKLFSTSFSVNTTGYKEGILVEENTFRDIKKGNLAGRGIAHFYEESELTNLLRETGFGNIIIDTLRYTDRGGVVEQFLVQAEK